MWGGPAARPGDYIGNIKIGPRNLSCPENHSVSYSHSRTRTFLKILRSSSLSGHIFLFKVRCKPLILHWLAESRPSKSSAKMWCRHWPTNKWEKVSTKMPLQFEILCPNHRLPHYLDFNPSSTPQLQESCNVTDWWASGPKQCIQDQIQSKSIAYKNQNVKFTPIPEFAHRKFFFFDLLILSIFCPATGALAPGPAAASSWMPTSPTRSHWSKIKPTVTTAQSSSRWSSASSPYSARRKRILLLTYRRCLTEALHASTIYIQSYHANKIFFNQAVSIACECVCIVAKIKANSITIGTSILRV